MKVLISAIGFIVCTAHLAAGAEHSALPRSSPEEQGVSSSAVLDFVDQADREIANLHSFMLVRHGHVVAEGWWTPYDAGTRHELYSLSKSFTSTAVGLAIAEGKLNLDDEVTAINSGGAAMGRIVATGRSGNSASCCPNRTPWWRSRAALKICRSCST